VRKSSEVATSRIDKVLEAARDAKQLLSLMNDRDGFIAAKGRSDRMGMFNRERDRLKEVTGYQQRELTAAVKHVITPPKLDDADEKIDKVDGLKEFNFFCDITEVINSWPDPIDGAWNWIKRAFNDDEFVLHATLERRKLETEYFADLDDPFATQIGNVRRAFERNLEAAERNALSLLDAREQSLKAHDSALKTRREQHQARLKELIGFQETYQDMKDALKQCGEQIREITREE
jgi:hypothetical protein